LKAIAKALAPLGPQVVFYLAAAVSDFYLPWSQLVRDTQLTIKASGCSLLKPALCCSYMHLWQPAHGMPA
jgi:hypothetical protein